MNTIARGNAAEAGVILALESAGLVTPIPFGGGCPFDVVAVLPSGDLLRVQVKSERVRENCVLFNAYANDHGHGRLHYRDRADLIGVHVPELGRVFMIDVNECPISEGRLRLEPTRNNQRKRIRFAEDYSFERWIASLSPAAAAA